MQQEFPEVFNCNKRKHFVKHSVIATVETSTETPIHSASRRLSPKQYKALKSELTRLLDQGILDCSQSPWTSPIVMVKKKTGDWRLCADFTNLSKVLDMQKYTLPNINDFAALAHDCKWFSALDVADAYYNIPVDPRHRHKLTIATPLGNYCYNYLPMGLASSSCYYQQLMNEAISNIPQVFCYLDDIIIMSKKFERAQTNSTASFRPLEKPWFSCKGLKMRRCRTKPFFLTLPRFFSWIFSSSKQSCSNSRIQAASHQEAIKNLLWNVSILCSFCERKQSVATIPV